MALGRDLLDAVRDLDSHDLRRLLILTQAQLERDGVFSSANRPKVRLRSQMVRCGKTNCGACPHGPYWYAVWWEEGRRRTRYVGRLLDEE
ncbi:MAG TPA: hypothetical protein VJ815_07260 [Acidimicrobiia bacterium]|nr:hypothetical protein [Acidimicrobiia bacterium]